VQERVREGEEFGCLGFQFDGNSGSHDVLCGTAAGRVLTFPLDMTQL